MEINYDLHACVDTHTLSILDCGSEHKSVSAMLVFLLMMMMMMLLVLLRHRNS